MPSRSETGHGVNLAQFDGLYQFTASLRTAYKPANPRLKRDALGPQLVECKAAFDGTESARTTFDGAVDNRAVAFKDLPKLCTRIMKSFRSSGAPARQVAGAESINKKLQGSRATPPPKKVDGAEAATERSVSQLSFDSILSNFEKLVNYLETSAAYTPGEDELSPEALRTRVAAMRAANAAVVPAEAALTEALLRRDILFYAPETGLVDTAKAVKEYIGSLDKAKVPAAASLSAFKFRNLQERLRKASLA